MAIDVSGLLIFPIGMAIICILCLSAAMCIRATIRQRKYLAKWDFLHAVEDAAERLNPPQSRDERIQNANDQTQQGDAS